MINKGKVIHPIAFYLPQYHPIPENDEWWGKGFTEWTNVAKAKPQFLGHYQPHLPADLGFYDLRLPEVRQAQADLAKAYGIYGFCYYHYWFNGRRLLERPFNEVLASGKPDFPFCLCWANETWSRCWDGSENEVLMEQVYSEEDDRAHMQWLARAFKDPRYIRIDGKPLFLVYRASKMPDPMRTANIWREEARRQGVGAVYLCRVESFKNEHADPSLIGFDASVEFQPDAMQLKLRTPLRSDRLWGVSNKIPSWKFWGLIQRIGLADPAYANNDIFDYTEVIQSMLSKPAPTYKRFPCVTPSWDNSARRRIDARIFHNSTPEAYEKWLKVIIERERANPKSDNIVFINAWNEWAEGNYLEPDQKWGRAYLQATLDALKTKCVGE